MVPLTVTVRLPRLEEAGTQTVSPGSPSTLLQMVCRGLSGLVAITTSPVCAQAPCERDLSQWWCGSREVPRDD